jgi:peptide/nickel transport system substrate-binding protein
MHSRNRVLLALFMLITLMLIVACQGGKEVEVTRIVKEKETIVERETIIEQETVIVEVTPTPGPVAAGPRELVICQGQEPSTLYVYGGSALAARHVQHAVYDGPIDKRTYGYQPIILQKLPSLSDGDAVIETITVETGDLAVDDALDVVTLEAGILVRPAGCFSSDCAVEFTGDPLEMEQMVVTFKLKEGILWSDGESLTAYDSVYSFDLLKDPDTPAGRYKTDRTASYEATDDNSTVWTGLPGFRDTTYFTNFWHPLPEHAWGDFTPLELVEAEESSRMPIGWGPYVITEWVAGDHITAVKNENYWRADEGLPKFDTVIFRFVGQNSEENIAAVLAEKCDIVDQTVQLDDQSSLLMELQAVGKLNAAFVASQIWEHADFGINPVESYERPDLFEDVRVRQAIAYCMDRQQIIDTVTFGTSPVLQSYLPPGHPFFNPDVKQYPYDPAAGSALLEEAGWIDHDGDPFTARVSQDVEGMPDGTPLEFNYWTSSATQQQQAARVLQASMAECSIKANLEHWSVGEYLIEGPEGPLFGRRFDVGQFAWVASPDPLCSLYLSTEIPSEENGWDGLNVSGFVNDEYDAACSAALQLLPGQPEYEQFHKEAQRIFAEQLPMVPLYMRLKTATTHPDLKGFIMDATESEMWNIEEFSY